MNISLTFEKIISCILKERCFIFYFVDLQMNWSVDFSLLLLFPFWFRFLLETIISRRDAEGEPVGGDADDGHEGQDGDEEVVVGVRLAADGVPFGRLVGCCQVTVLKVNKSDYAMWEPIASIFY